MSITFSIRYSRLFRDRLCSQICAFLPSRRAQYQPLTLNRLQYLIDLGRIDPTQPIDLTQLVNGRGVTIQPQKRDYGVQLVGEVFTLATFTPMSCRDCVSA